MQQPTTDEGRWEATLYYRLVAHAMRLVNDSRRGYGLPLGYAGETPLIMSVPHWGGQRAGWFESAGAVLGANRLSFAMYAYIVQSVVAAPVVVLPPATPANLRIAP